MPVRGRSAVWLTSWACRLVSAVPQGASPTCRPGSAAFHEDGNRSPGERRPALVQPEQQAALLEAGGLGAVEVPGHVGRFAIRMDPADEPCGLSVVVVHGEHDPVPEDVDERSPG
jgi:hypothetical protein